VPRSLRVENTMGDHVVGRSELNGEGLDKVLADTRRALQAVRSAPTTDGEPIQGAGSASDGRVRVVTQAPGHVTALELDPRLMRLSSEDLAAEIVIAVNAAFDDLRTKAVEAVMPADLGAMSSQLEDLQNESVRQLERFTSAISGAVEQIRSRRG